MKMADGDGDANQLGRQDLSNESSSEDEDELNQVDHLKVGSYYELDHSRLPPNAPIQLQSIRIVAVSSKNGRGVTVRYPSTFALKSHFKVAGGLGRSGASQKPNLSPEMDEKYTMGFRVAAEALFKRIKPDEYVKGRGLWRFWTATGKGRAAAVETQSWTPLVYQRGATRGIRSKSGECLTALSSGRVLKWGKRQRVRFEPPRGGRGDLGNPVLITPPLIGEEKGKESEDGGSDDAGDDEEEDDEVEEEKLVVKDDVKPLIQLRRNRKRKCKVLNYNLQAKKKSKKTEVVPVKRKLGLSSGHKQSGRKESICRWSKDRYKLAEENMLKIMKAMGATIHKPIMRQTLRDEARKQIGDTGLLDHLLKHMAGKVAPGGADRFRRRHNAEGTMEYWLESADLVEIRKQAGVSDPYWMPKPGWKLGDNPSQDPACALKIKELEDQLENVKRDVQELLMNKQAEQDIMVTTPLSSLTDQIIPAYEIGAHPLKELQEDLLMKKAQLEKLMSKVSQDLTEMEILQKEIEKRSKVDRTRKLLDSEAADDIATPETEKKDTDGSDQEMTNRSVEVVPSSGTVARTMTVAEAAAAKAEEKAALIERLKSGFRICKPQGTFLWPSVVVTSAADSPVPVSSMTSSSQVFSSTTPTEYNHLLAAQTPPSVSSTTTNSPSLPLLPQPAPPVKPLAKRHGSAVIIPASTALYDRVAARVMTTSTTAPTTLFDLNHAPATNNLQNDSIKFFGGGNNNNTLSTFGHRQDYYKQSFSMVGSNSDLQSLHNVQQVRMIPKLEAAETNCIPVSVDQQKHKKATSGANASPSSLTAGATTNTWRPVPSPGRLFKHKLNQ